VGIFRFSALSSAQNLGISEVETEAIQYREREPTQHHEEKEKKDAIKPNANRS
jgi:hypothetical protein